MTSSLSPQILPLAKKISNPPPLGGLDDGWFIVVCYIYIYEQFIRYLYVTFDRDGQTPSPSGFMQDAKTHNSNLLASYQCLGECTDLKADTYTLIILLLS